MDIREKSILVTGANRGIGLELVRALLKHGAGKVYAAAREPASLPDFGDARVVPVRMDITDPAQVEAAADAVGALDVLVNNAGVMNYADVLTATPAALAIDMDVNYYGSLRVTQAFVPLLEKQGGGAIVNILSVAALAPPSAISGYSASKAALFSATTSLRMALKPKRIEVIGVFPGPIDTDLAKDLPLSKASPIDTAEHIVRGIGLGEEDIYPDPTSSQLAALWKGDPKALQHFFANMPG